MSGEAIQFSIGGDNSGLVRVLKDSEDRAAKSAGTINQHLQNAGKGGEKAAEGFEKYLRSEQRVHRNILSTAELALRGGSAMDVMAEGAIRVTESLKLGLGMGVGIGVLALFSKTLAETSERTEELEKKLRELRNEAQNTGSSFQSAQAAQSLASDAATTADKVREGSFVPIQGETSGQVIGNVGHNISSAWSGAMEKVAAMFSGDNEVAYSTISDNQNRRIKSAEEAEAAAKRTLAEKENRAADIANEQLNGSSFQAAKLKLETQRDERIGSAEGNLGLQDAIRREFEVGMDSLRRNEETRIRAWMYGMTAANIRSAGGNVAVGLAQNDLNAANAEKSDARTTDEKDAASLKVKNAEYALRVAREQADVTDKTMSAELKMASIRTGSGDTQIQTLEQNVALARALLSDYTDISGQQQRQVDLARAQQTLAEARVKNEDSLRALMNQSAVTGARMRDASPVETARLALTQAEKEYEIRKSRGDVEKEQAANEVSARQLALRDAEREKDLADAVARIKTDAMREQISGNDHIAKQMRDQIAIEEQAIKLDRAGLHEQAQNVRNQGSLQNYSDAFNEAYDPSTGNLRGQSSRMRAYQQWRDAQRKAGAAQERFNRTGGLLSPHYNADGDLVNGFDPRLGFNVGSDDPNAPKISIDPKTGQRIHTMRDGSQYAEDAFGKWNWKGGPGSAGKSGMAGHSGSSAAETAADKLADHLFHRDNNRAANDAAPKQTPNDPSKDGSDKMDKMEAHLASIEKTLTGWDK